jgi:Putative beta-barrel porin 2
MNPQNACLLGAGLCVLWPALLAAQQIDPSRLGEATRPLSVPSLRDSRDFGGLGLEDENPFAPDSPGDDDIGQQMILRESPRDRWFSAQADAFLYWTDNPANLSEGGDDDFFWGGRVSVTAQPRLGRRLYGDVMVGQQIYRYDRYDFLDYEYFEASAGLIYLEPKLMDSILYVQGYFNRMTTDDFGEDIVNSFSIRAGIQKAVVFDRKNSVHVNLMGDWDVHTDDDLLDRFEYTADLGYNYKIMRDLVFGASYRFTWYDYRDIDREDALSLLGVNLVWSPRKWLDVYVSGSYSFNESNLDVFDYEAATVGGGLGVRLRF